MTVQRPLFADRTEAGRQLAEQVVASGETDAIVYALPRGGVPVALEVARALDAPLDLVLVRKIGAPGHPEVALAAVVDGGFPQMVVNEAVQRMSGASPLYLAREKALALAEIERRRRLYFGNRTHPAPAAGGHPATARARGRAGDSGRSGHAGDQSGDAAGRG